MLILSPSLGSTPRRSGLVITSVLAQNTAPGASVLTTLPSRDVREAKVLGA